MIKRLLNKIINSYLEISDIQVKSDMKKETIWELCGEIIDLKKQFDAGIVKDKSKKNKNIANKYPDLKVYVIILLYYWEDIELTFPEIYLQNI